MRTAFYFQLILLALYLFYIGHNVKEKMYYMNNDDFYKYIRMMLIPTLKMFLFATVIFGLIGVIWFRFITAAIPAAIFISSIAYYKMERKNGLRPEIKVNYPPKMDAIQKRMVENSSVFAVFMVFSFIIGITSVF